MVKKSVGGASHTSATAGASKKEPSVHREPAHTKHVKIKHHHAKPYRKRHYGSLIILLVMSLTLLLLIVKFNTQIQENTDRARSYLIDLFTQKQADQKTVSSTYGFNVVYSPTSYYASALDATSGSLYMGDELNITRAYQVVRISSSWNATVSQDASLTLEYQQGADGTQSLEAIQSAFVAKESSDQSKLVKIATSQTLIDGKTFLKTEWRRSFNASVASQISPRLTTYVGIVNGKPFTILLNHGTSDDVSGYNTIIKSITFGKKTAFASTSSQAATSTRNIFDSVMFANVAKAASTKAAPTTEYISSLYGPTVVRVYNAYCQNISIDGKPYLNNVCSAGVGSGFIVSSDGYVATNGHVAGSSPKDAAISDAVNYLLRGDQRWFIYLADLSGLKDSDLASAKSRKEVLAIAVNKFYEIPDSRFTVQNAVSNLLVTLGEQQPDVKELLTLTTARKEYTEQDTIKRATLTAIDYRLLDGINGFKASDVAIIKISGSNYPVAKLGAVTDVSQGSVLNILGFPAGANSNSLVDDTKSKVTLTTGKVSAIKDAQGNGKKLIETDTEIGHGNSGGPAMNDQGTVVGIATYTIDGSGSGNGVFNYIRDIGDLKDLAAKSSVTFNTKSATQAEWQKGIDAFYQAHYSKAIKNFEKVKTLYPSHPTAASLIDTANANIKAGKEVKEFPIIIVLSALLIVVLLGAGIAIVIIVRHRKKHDIYQQNVSAGNIQPMQPGDPAQYVNPYPMQQMVAPAQPGVGQPQQPMPMQQQYAAPAQQPVQQIAPTQPTAVPVQQAAPPQVIAPTQPPQPPQAQG